MSLSSKSLPTTLVALLALSGCGKPATSGNTTSAQVNISNSALPVSGAPTGDVAILAAAEPFEKLTETSFSATPAVLDGTIAEVQTATQRLKGVVSADVTKRLEVRLNEIASARQSDNRADLAISAVEGYRVLVGAVSSNSKVPTAVNLLDYVGFRYDADLKAKPSRWQDMKQAVTFGREQWTSIAPRVTDAALRARMDKALTEMDGAVATQHASAASAVAQRELALVDELEKFFNGR